MDDDRMYVQLQKIACACVCPFLLFLTSPNTLLWWFPTGRTILKKIIPWLSLACLFLIVPFLDGTFLALDPEPGSRPWSDLWTYGTELLGVAWWWSPWSCLRLDTIPLTRLLVQPYQWLKKYRMFMCLVRFLLESLPFFFKIIEFLLSQKKRCPRFYILDPSKNTVSNRSQAWRHRCLPVQSL